MIHMSKKRTSLIRTKTKIGRVWESANPSTYSNIKVVSLGCQMVEAVVRGRYLVNICEGCLFRDVRVSMG